MSSDPTGLHNLGYVPRYEEILARNLPPGFSAFADFFSGTQRLHTLGAICARHVRGKGLHVLNVGSGPFAIEIFVEAMQGQSIVALDYTPEFAPFHPLFRSEGHLSGTEFLQADVMTQEFDANAFDMIILHDVLYETALDLGAVIRRLDRFLKPGGLLFFDFVNARTRWIWRMLGRPDRFRRYDPGQVRALLQELDHEIVVWRPTHGARHPAVRVVHAALRAAGTANNYAVLSRKAGPPT